MEKFSTADIKAGDDIYVAEMGSWNVRMTKLTATRVTPTGRVIWVYGSDGEYKKTWGPDGQEIGGSKRYGSRLVSKERYDEWVAEQEAEKRVRQIREAIVDTAKIPLHELDAKLVEIRAQLKDHFAKIPV